MAARAAGPVPRVPRSTSPPPHFSPSAPTMANGFFYEWTVTLGTFTYTTTTTTTLATSPSPFSFTPGQAGTYVVHLSAFDYHGFQGQDATQTVVVTAVPQSVTITGLPDDATTTLGSSLSLGASVTAATTALQNAGFLDTWTVQYGGATYGPYSGPTLNLTADGVGVYTITLAAEDAEGVTASTTSLIDVVDTAPEVSSSSSTQDATQGPSTEFALGTATGSSLSYGAGTVRRQLGRRHDLDLYDRVGRHLARRAHNYALPGNYAVSVTVTDAFGMNSTSTFTASVAGVPPSPSILGLPSTVNAGSTVTLGSSVSDPSQAEAALGFSYSWSVTKDGVPYAMPGNPATNLAGFTFQPTAAGTYVVNLAVTDHNNDVGYATSSFTISAASTAVSGSTSGASVGSSSPDGDRHVHRRHPGWHCRFLRQHHDDRPRLGQPEQRGNGDVESVGSARGRAAIDRTVLHQQHERLQLFQHDAQRERASLCLRAECDGRRGAQRFG